MEPKVSFSLTDTHGEPTPWYTLELKLENFASPDDLLARLDQLRDTIAVRFQKKFQIGLIIDADDKHEAALRLKRLQEAVEGSNLFPDDASELEYQINAAIVALVEPEPLSNLKARRELAFHQLKTLNKTQQEQVLALIDLLENEKLDRLDAQRDATLTPPDESP